MDDLQKVADMSHQEKLARVIDPDGWDMFDKIVKMGRKKKGKDLVEDSLELADTIIKSGLMASETWERKEYFNAMDRIKRATSGEVYCTNIYGDVKHSVKCTYWPDTAISGSGCISESSVRRGRY